MYNQYEPVSHPVGALWIGLFPNMWRTTPLSLLDVVVTVRRVSRTSQEDPETFAIQITVVAFAQVRGGAAGLVPACRGFPEQP